MKKFLAILLIGMYLNHLAAATRTWSSGGSTDMNDDANYSGAGALLTTDDLVFDATSVVNATATADLEVNSITATAAYSGAWSMGSTYKLTVNEASDSAINYKGTGATTWGDSLVLAGTNATVHIGGAVASLTAAACDVVFNGGGTWDVDKGSTWQSLTIAASQSLTTTGALYQFFKTSGTPLTMGNNATLTCNHVTDDHFAFYRQSSGDAFSIGTGCTINGTRSPTFRGEGAIVLTMPAFTYTGTDTRVLAASGTATVHTFRWTGNWDLGAAELHIYDGNQASTLTIDFDQYGITTTGNLAIGRQKNTGGLMPISMGSGTFNIGSFNQYSTFNALRQNLDLETATINCAGSFEIYDSCTVTRGSAKINLTGAATVTTDNERLPRVNVNAPGGTVNFADRIYLDTLTVAAGTVTHSGTGIDTLGYLSIDGGTWNITNDTIAVTSNGKGSTAGAISGSSTSLLSFSMEDAHFGWFPGDTIPGRLEMLNSMYLDSGGAVARITTVAGKTYTYQDGKTFVFDAIPGNDLSGTAGNIIHYKSSTPGTAAIWECPTCDTITVQYTKFTDITAQ